MKKLFFLMIVLVSVVISSCNQAGTEQKATQDEAVIDKPQLTLTSNRMTPEVLWSFGRLSDPQVSPDGKTILYGVTYYSIEQNKGNRDLYAVDADGSNQRRITKTAKSEYNALWRPDGKKIGFLTTESGSMQMWEMNPDGTGRKQISDIEGGITGFKYSPDQSMVVYTKEIPVENKFKDIYEGLPKATGRLIDNLMYRHWDTWTDTYTHIFLAQYDGAKLTGDKDVLPGEPWDAPMKPWGGMEQVNFSPDSKSLVYTSKKLEGKEYSLSTNSENYIYNIANGETKNITLGMMGFDIAPQYSPDGNYIAWESMERDGFESDLNRLYIFNVATGERTFATKSLDQNVANLLWSADSRSVYFVSDVQGTFQIYEYKLEANEVRKVTEGQHDYGTIAWAGDQLVATKQTMALPTELFMVDPMSGAETQITFTNKDLLGQLAMGKTVGRWMKTFDGMDMLTWIIYPPDFDSTKKYPTLLYLKGGPQGPLSQDFHYRWNYQIMAANDYIIVAPSRRGVSGFGQAWQEQISTDYHGKSMKDYLTAIDIMAKEPYVDADHLGAIGASAGGWAAYYLAGNHEGRFKAFIAHDGIFNEEAQYLETEEMWFENWDKGGPFWEKNNKIIKDVYENSPHKFVQNWDTPILVIHGEQDFRVVYTQGMTAFNAAILRGVPAEFLFFPDENHWVLQPQNGILWQRTFFAWLDKWLKK